MNGGNALNKKQKQELRQRQTARQLMGISQLTGHGIRTAEGELAFFLIRPDNLSVLSSEGVRGRVTALTHLLCAMPELRILALDSGVLSAQSGAVPPAAGAGGTARPAGNCCGRTPPIWTRSRPPPPRRGSSFWFSGWISRAERATRSSSARWISGSGIRASTFGLRRSRTLSACWRSTTSRT